MDFIQQLQNWSNGDTLQGWIMVGMAVLFILFILSITKSDNLLLKGMLIPFGLLLLMNLGYGSYLVYTKSKNEVVVEQQFHKNPKQTLQNQLIKLQKEAKSYSSTTKIWAVFLVVSVLLYFVLTKQYYKGLALGLMLMFLGMLLIDAFLFHRLKEYVSALKGNI